MLASATGAYQPGRLPRGMPPLSVTGAGHGSVPGEPNAVHQPGDGISGPVAEAPAAIAGPAAETSGCARAPRPWR